MSTKTETPEQLFERVDLRLRTEGLEAAVNGLIRVCKDEKSPPPAVATAGVALLRANGVLVDKSSGGKKAKDPSEMTGDELQAEIDRLKRAAREVVNPAEAEADNRESAFD
ncbi:MULTISPECIES: hypothetical protein [unclassified Mesorhizobium]|uniref:hypothetical protein n=1 Tax=unclassified Mesorhizobium TaxID=325217 RepID=UPI00112A6FDC|nr:MULTISPECIES: hypothetical protein [unclassified Mesorhizobium]MBZ9742362.1 hypothetical protein [Mesorhizobium sp. CO1-1-4]TPL87120.1 hypothetical protein FJ948_21730 [Mesorhizobium sp. B2-3-12]